MEIPSKVFIILGILVSAFSYIHYHLTKTMALVSFIIIGGCFTVYGIIKYFFIEKEQPKPKHKIVHHGLRHAPIQHYNKPQPKTHVTCPKCQHIIGVEANFCPSCGFARSHTQYPGR